MTPITSIRNKDDLGRANDRLDYLLRSGEGSSERDEYRSLFKLVAEYQDLYYPVEIPDGIGMIEFYLENANLAKSDLIPLIGSEEKVSAVMSGREQLTVPMIRALNKHLGVDFESLVGYVVIDEDEGIHWTKFPIEAMKKLGWFSTPAKSDRELVEELIKGANGLVQIPRTYCRKNFDARRNTLTDIYSLQAWCQKVVGVALAHPPINVFKKNFINQNFITKLASLVELEDGPRKAIEALSEAGIALIYVDQLPEMYVDSVVMTTQKGHPVIGLTLRDDSIQSFWFSVLHSVAHIWKHLSDLHYFFVDDFNLKECHCNVDWSLEKEADEIAIKAIDSQKAEIETYSDMRIAAEAVKLTANSISMKVTERYPDLKPISKPLQTKSIQEYFL